MWIIFIYVLKIKINLLFRCKIINFIKIMDVSKRSETL